MKLYDLIVERGYSIPYGTAAIAQDIGGAIYAFNTPLIYRTSGGGWFGVHSNQAIIGRLDDQRDVATECEDCDTCILHVGADGKIIAPPVDIVSLAKRSEPETNLEQAFKDLLLAVHVSVEKDWDVDTLKVAMRKADEAYLKLEKGE